MSKVLQETKTGKEEESDDSLSSSSDNEDEKNHKWILWKKKG